MIWVIFQEIEKIAEMFNFCGIVYLFNFVNFCGTPIPNFILQTWAVKLVHNEGKVKDRWY